MGFLRKQEKINFRVFDSNFECNLISGDSNSFWMLLNDIRDWTRKKVI